MLNKLFVSAFLVLSLTACGGSGSSDDIGINQTPADFNPNTNNNTNTLVEAASDLEVLGKSSTSVRIQWQGVLFAENIIYRDNVELARFDSSVFVEYTDENLMSNTSYSYSIQIVDNEGNVSEVTPAITVTTNSPETAAPNKPEDFEIDTYTSTELELDWFDDSSDETGFRIYQLDANNNKSLVVELPLGTNFYTVEDLSYSTTYTFEVVAFNGVGESEGVTVEGTTLKDPVKPQAPTNVSVSSVSASTITLSFTDNADNEDGYFITIGDSLFVDEACYGENLIECTITDLDPGTSYNLQLGSFVFTELGNVSRLLTSTTVSVDNVSTSN